MKPKLGLSKELTLPGNDCKNRTSILEHLKAWNIIVWNGNKVTAMLRYFLPKFGSRLQNGLCRVSVYAQRAIAFVEVFKRVYEGRFHN